MSKKTSRRTWWALSNQFLIALLVFLIPSNLFLKGWLTTAYVQGLAVDYLIPKFFLIDVVVIGLLVTNWKVLKTHWQLLTGFALFLAVNILVSSQWSASLWYALKLWSLLGIGLSLSQHKQFLSSKAIQLTLALTVAFQSLLGWYQFIVQKSLGGYWLLGQTDLSSYAGLARASFSGLEKILPYGTTPHPNVLAGFLVLSLLILWKHKTQLPGRVLLALSGLALATVFLTQSLSAWLALAIGCLFLIQRPRLAARHWLAGILAILLASPLVLVGAYHQLPGQSSLGRRVALNQAAWNIFLEKSLTGVGLNAFTTQAERSLPHNKTAFREVTRFTQPAHHLGLLWLAETGLLGILGLVSIGYFYRRFWIAQLPTVAVLLPLMVLDHYLLTLSSGSLIAIFFVLLMMEDKASTTQG